MLKFVSLMLAVAGLLAAGEGEGRGCSLASLKGTYGFLVMGIKPSGAPPAPLEQMIGVSMATYDGQGHFTGFDNIHSAISPLSPDRPGSGTYTVNEDCSGSSVLIIPGGPPLEQRFVLVDKGKEIRTAVMSPATVMVTAIGRKI
jgi:hypothetical protein